MKVLVTGGAGYLGSEIARVAEQQGRDVLVTQLEREPAHGRPLRVDLRDEAATIRCLTRQRAEVVIHTAYRQADAELRDSVVRATRNVALAARRTGARLVHVSTDLVFDGEHDGPYAESDVPRPVSRYGEAKLAAERLVAARDPAALVVRTSLLYGKAGPQEALALRDDVTFYSDEIRTPIRVDDLARALLELAGTELAGLLHVAGPDAVSRLDFARVLAAAQGRDPHELRGAPSPRHGRARNVALDSSRAASFLRTPIRGVG